jgi:hypothetical protein
VPDEADEALYDDEPPVHEAPEYPQAPPRRPSSRPLPGGRVRTPSPPLNPAPLPFPVRPISPGEGPQRPPLPGARGEAPATDHPIPWPEAASRRTSYRQAHAHPAAPVAEDIAGAPYPAVVDETAPYVEAPAAHMPQRRSMRSALGRLLDGVPRMLYVATPATIEVRIPRDWIEVAAGGADMRSAPARFIVRAVSVRLRSPDGRLWIEAGSPETLWVENSQGLSQDDASWRWLITPRQRGTARVLVMLSARSVGPDGLAAEIAVPDQIADIRVLPNVRETLVRAGGWGAAIVAGIVLGRLGGGVLSAIGHVLGRMIGL